MPIIDSSLQGMNWKTYLQRIRYAFGDNSELADAYCEGYEKNIRRMPWDEGDEEILYTGMKREAYRQGLDDAEDDKKQNTPAFIP